MKKLKLILSILMWFPIQISFAQKINKFDSLEYHSAIFKDTLNVCDGFRRKSYDYIMKSNKVNHRNIKKLTKYLGVEGVSEEQGYKVYYYALWCNCFENGPIPWPGCDYIAIKTKRNRIIKIYGKHFS